MSPQNYRTAMDSFSERVVEAARSIPPGRVSTYGAIARAAGGGPIAARSVTSILGKAFERGVTDIPFHRIVYSDGRIWIDAKHHAARMKLYKKEGIKLDAHNRIIDFADRLFEF